MFKKLHKLIVSSFRKIIKPFSGHGIGKFYPIGAMYQSLHSFLKISDDAIEVQGSKMFLDPEDTLTVFRNGIYEPATTKIFKKEIKKGDVALDVGAHIGYYTLLFAKLVGEKGKAYAFEPNSVNFDLLKKNVEINNYNNVVLERKAVSDKSEKGKLFLSEEGTGIHSIYDIHGSHKFAEVEFVKLDDYFKNYNGKIDWIKIDIEGAELSALRGMTSLLAKNKNIKIIAELATCCLEESNTRPEEYFKFFKENGFFVYNINNDNEKIEACDTNKLLKLYTLENRRYTNLFCVREKLSL